MKRILSLFLICTFILTGCRTRHIGADGSVYSAGDKAAADPGTASMITSPPDGRKVQEEGKKADVTPTVEYMEFSDRKKDNTPAMESASQSISKEAKELSKQEISYLNGQLPEDENGFFLSTYYRPEEIVWSEVLYNGSSIKVMPDEKQLAAIRTLLGQNVDSGSIMAVYDRDVIRYVQEKTGTDYGDARHPLLWDRLEDGLMFITRTGSTGQKIKISSGVVDGDLYQFIYSYSSFDDSSDDHEYVMTARIDDGNWQYISNLPANEVPPQTLLDISFYRTEMELAAAGVTESIQMQPSEADMTDNWYFALISAPEGKNVQIQLDKRSSGHDTDGLFFANDVFIPMDGSYTTVIPGGQSIAVHLCLSPYQTTRLLCSYQTLEGEYIFGQENWLGRFDETGLPKPVYVAGYESTADDKNPSFADEDQMAYFMAGDWIYYDPETAEPKALIRINEFREMQVISLADESLLWLNTLTPGEGGTGQISLAVYDPDTVAKLSDVFADNQNIGTYNTAITEGEGVQLITLTKADEEPDILSYLLSSGSSSTGEGEEPEAEAEEGEGTEDASASEEEQKAGRTEAAGPGENTFVLHRYTGMSAASME